MLFEKRFENAKNVLQYATLRTSRLPFVYFERTLCVLLPTVRAYYASTKGTLRKVFIDRNCRLVAAWITTLIPRLYSRAYYFIILELGNEATLPCLHTLIEM